MIRAPVVLCLAIAVGLFAFAAAMGLTDSLAAAGALSAMAAVAAGWAAQRWLFVGLKEDGYPRALLVVSAVAASVALVRLARLTVFVVAPAQVGMSTIPGSTREIRHCCTTAYFVAAKANAEGRNVYDGALYSVDDDPSRKRQPRTIGSFDVDVYEYPPPFLLLPRLVDAATGGEFERFRMLWFALNGLIALLGMLFTARLLGPTSGMRALLLLPAVWAALPMLNSLQKGNVQLTVVSLSMLSMAAFLRQRARLGGAMLAFATVSKLFPGILVPYLIVRREWRAAAWSAAMGAAFVVLGTLVLGTLPFWDFLGHLPGLLGGEAFPAFRNPRAVAINTSLPGLVFKLGLFGVPGMSFDAARIVGWLYTLVLLGAVVWAARREARNGASPLLWLSILVLASLRSPFLPQAYAVFPPLWLLTLWAAVAPMTRKTLVIGVASWLALNVYWPLDWPLDPRAIALLNGIPQTVMMVLAVGALRRATSPEPAAEATTSGDLAPALQR